MIFAEVVIQGSWEAFFDVEFTINFFLAAPAVQLLVSPVKPEEFDYSYYSQELVEFYVEPRPYESGFWVWREVGPGRFPVKIKFSVFTKIKDVSPSDTFAPRPDNSEFSRLALSLTKKCRSQTEAVIKIVNFVNKKMKYDISAENLNFDQAWREGRGVCHHFAKATVKLLQSLGIKAVEVSGISIKRKWKLHFKKGRTFMEWEHITYEGRHSWVEVYYPSVGWLPVDPQGFINFVPPFYVVLNRSGKPFEARVEATIPNFSFQEKLKARILRQNFNIKVIDVTPGPDLFVFR